MANILYYMGDNGSGIEQIGYIYVLLLKKLGHDIDLYITQDVETQINIGKHINSMNYDCIVLNEPSDYLFDRLNIDYSKNNVYSIQHSFDSNYKLDLRLKILSLNYHLHYKYKQCNLMFPLAYPFEFGLKNNIKDKNYNTCFVGRFSKEKFHPEMVNYLKKNNIKLDLGILSKDSYKDNLDVFKEIKNNLKIDEVYNLLGQCKYLLLPSITECLSLVVGEALVNNCIPIVLDTEYKEHEQFLDSIICYSIKEFKNKINEINNLKHKIDLSYYKNYYNIFRILKQLELYFGKGNKPFITTPHKKEEYINKLEYINAKIITGEQISPDGFPEN